MSKSRMLVAVSSPWASENLAKPIADLAQRLDAQAVVAHVAQVQQEDQEETDARQRGQQTLQVMADVLDAHEIEHEGVMLFSNDVAKAIVNTARARECSLIVLGLTNKSLLKRLIAGDVPANILRQVEIPVLLCPPHWQGPI